jgi:predicted transcriptional regulator
MSVLELKTKFHQLIDRIDDEKQLEALYGFVAEQTLEAREAHQLSEEEVTRIKSSLAKLERGEGIPHEMVMAEVREWLKK